MVLFVSAVGWLSARGMGEFQTNLLRTFDKELLNEGSPEFLTALRQLYCIYENLPPSIRTGNSARDLAPFLSPEDAHRYLILDGQGKPGADRPLDPALEALTGTGVLAAFWEEAKNGGPREIALDNYIDYLDGKAGTPAMVHLRAYPERDLMLGMGRLKEITDIRLESIAEISTAAYDSRIRRETGLYICLILLSLSAVWITVQYFFFLPLARHMGTASGGVEGPPHDHLTWARFRDYTARARQLESEKTAQRGKLQREIEARFQAEAERDSLKGNMERALKDCKIDLQKQAEQALGEIQATILRREARVLLNQLQPGLESALHLLPAGADTSPARDALTQCLVTVRALGNRRAASPLELREMVLQPWLEDIVSRFQADRSVPVVANIAAGTRARIEPEALRQAVEFVMENAATASRDGAGIRVDSARDGDTIEIRILDNGLGIPEEARPHVFVPFFTLAAQSNGLGLAVARSVVEEHGGTILIQTESDKGTAVIIRLPAA